MGHVPFCFCTVITRYTAKAQRLRASHSLFVDHDKIYWQRVNSPGSNTQALWCKSQNNYSFPYVSHESSPIRLGAVELRGSSALPTHFSSALIMRSLRVKLYIGRTIPFAVLKTYWLHNNQFYDHLLISFDVMR